MEPLSNSITNQVTCKNCGSDLVAEFCSSCGQKTLKTRFTLKSSLLFLLSAFNFEKGFFYTMKMLFLDPGKVVNDYLGGRTKIYYNPLNYLLLITGISAILIVWLGIFDANVANTNELFGIEQNQDTLLIQSKMNAFIKQYINIISLLVIPFISLVSKWVYSKKKLFYGEHLILNSFVQAQVSAIGLALFPFYKIIPGMYHNVMPIGYTILLIYYSYALRKIFKSSIFKSILRAAVINLVGMILFMFTIMLIMIIFIIILKFSGQSIKDML